MRTVVALCAALALTIGGGCGRGDATVVLAASSLRTALDGADPAARTSFASSGILAAQIRQGASADVVILADPALLAGLERDGLVGMPTTIGRNRLAVLVSRTHRGRVASIADLGRGGMRLAVAAEGVPLGDYSRQALRRLNAMSVLVNVVTEEPDAAGVVGKVALGEVDAGIGYLSDLAGGRVDGFALPESAQPDIRYQAAVVARTGRRGRAEAYVGWLRGPDGRARLTGAGFIAP